jgi:hypothetical protein
MQLECSALMIFINKRLNIFTGLSVDSICRVHLRENRLRSLGKKLGHELDEDFRRAGNRLREILIRDFEMALAKVFP